MQFVGHFVALYNTHERRFLLMADDGSIGPLDDTSVNPGNLEAFRTWERFEVVDAGDGKIALHCAAHNRFIRIDGVITPHDLRGPGIRLTVNPYLTQRPPM